MTTNRLRLSAKGIVADGDTALDRTARFADAVLRGIGQVMLQNNSYAGLLFLFGIFYNSTLFGFAVLVGTVVSTAVALALGVDRARVRDGLFGFNGALVGIALLYFLQPDALAWCYVVLASACAPIAMAALSRALDTWSVPALTAPFVFTTYCFVLACARFGRLHSTHLLPTAGLPKAATVEGIVTASTVLHGLFTGVAQIFFQASVVTGILFTLGLLVSSRAACVAALLGSLAGLLTGWLLGAAEPALSAGAFGFNPALTAIALGSVFLARDATSVVYAALATIVTAVVFAAVSAALGPIGMPALTLPFVLVVWLFLLAKPMLPSVRANVHAG